ncbi:MAG: hypothetical protein JXQ71_17145 [Verrucomicrobia bacterium]|nr:hypothetical protein [Verrucomicrobiota bacterium]
MPTLPTSSGVPRRKHVRRAGRPARGRGAFTLIEVVLALLIAMSLLLGVMFFYSQAADLRGQLLREADRLASIRLVMERFTADLRCACADFAGGAGLKGDATSLSFLSAALPSAEALQTADPGRPWSAEADLRRVSYRAVLQVEETNTVVAGLTREEQSLAEPRAVEDIFEEFFDPLLWDAEEPAAEEPLTDAIHFVRFRYWDGSAWQASWDSVELPRGVEVSFGSDPLPEDLTPDEYPFELFRRIIHLPGSGVKEDLSWLELLGELWPEEEASPPPDDPQATP